MQNNSSSNVGFWQTAPDPSQQQHHPSNEWTAPSPQHHPSNEWTAPLPHSGPVYGGQPYGFRPPFPPAPPPILEGYGGPPRMGHGYGGFDPSIPPPSFNCPPPGPFPRMQLNPGQRSLHQGDVHPCSDLRPQAGPSNAWFEDVHNNPGASNSQRFDQHSTENCSFGTQSGQSEYQPNSNSLRQHGHRDLPAERGPLLDNPSFPAWSKDHNQSCVKATEAQPLDEEAVQRRQDEQWVKRFLQNRGKTFRIPDSEQPRSKISVPLIQNTLYDAVELVSKLSLACETLKHNLENESVWADSYAMALKLKGELQDKMKVVNDPECVDGLKNKLSRIAKKRAWQRRKKLKRIEEKQIEKERIAEKEAAIDKWRLKKILEVEEKKREQELKLAADSVLSEVLKKQADVKRMLDILRSLEKLRKLRKEAASRKGIFPEQEADEVFDKQLEQLRALIRKRTAVYGAEENTLRCMLEGEQEEERKKDLEKRLKKERDRQLQKKREIEALLFGDEMPADRLLQPFREYYTQAEHSLPALVQIRREWDVFLVPVDHPDGTAIPQGWVLPEAPSDKAWASALDNANSQP